jgi:hypothetical protein
MKTDTDNGGSNGGGFDHNDYDDYDNLDEVADESCEDGGAFVDICDDAMVMVIVIMMMIMMRC